MVLQRYSLKQLFQTSQDIIQSGDFSKTKTANKREIQSAADVVAGFQNTGEQQKTTFPTA